MPRKKLIRRFDPRCGVSRAVVETEAQALAREAEDYQIQALAELKQMLTERKKLWKQADETLRQMLLSIPERERLVLQCLLFRDFYHMLELYLEHSRAQPVQSAQQQAATACDDKPTPFSEWLFAEQ